MNERAARRLLVSTQVKRFLASTEYAEDARAALFSILFNPCVDHRRTFEPNCFPHMPGTRLMIDDTWYVVYRVEKNGDVWIATMLKWTHVFRPT